MLAVVTATKTATQCNALELTATHRNTIQLTATRCSEEDMLAVVAAVATGNEVQVPNDTGVDSGVDAAYIVQVKLHYDAVCCNV